MGAWSGVADESNVDNGHWLDQLNPQQREAATAGDGPILVIAGAGTGKTRTLAYRVAFLLEKGVEPERILLLTFTRRAAQEMLNRATNVTRKIAEGRANTTSRGLQPARSGNRNHATRVWGGTFHATANRLLRVYGDAIGLGSNFNIVDAGDAADLINIVRQEQGLTSKEKRFPRKATCLAIYSRCVNSGDSLADVLDGYFPWCADFEDELKALFAGYVDAKQARGVLDYDDLLLFWNELLKSKTLGPKIGGRFDHILVDEYQDTNRVQADILRAMHRDCPNVMVVGDDAQSIYSFRGAEVENILNFPDQFPGTRLITLEQNYRSVQSILDATNAVMLGAKQRYTKELWSNRRSDSKPTLIICRDEDDQTRTIIDRVLEHYEEGIPLQRQAVLFRAGHNADQLEVELTRRNIPYVKYGGLKFLEAAHIKDIMAFLRILENPQDQLAWSRSLNLLDGVGPKTAAAAYEHVRSAGFNPAAIATFSPPTAGRASFAAFASLVVEMTVDGGSGSVSDQLHRIRKIYDPLVEATYEPAEPRLRDLDQLEHIAQRYQSRRAFLDDLVLDPPSSTSDFAGPPMRDEDWLVLSTIHSAKGCEWDVVYVIHAADGVIPSDMATGRDGEIDEERRLFYVALTRARDRLYVSAPLRYYVAGRPMTDRHSYAQLTRFITDDVRRQFDVVSPEPALETEDAITDVDDADSIRSRLRARWD